MRFDLTPHQGAGNIKLGMTREDVHSILGKPENSSEKYLIEHGDVQLPVPAKDGYFRNELQITFDDENRADFIEFYGKGADHIEVFLNAIDVFKIGAPNLIDHITQSTGAHYDTNDKEIPYSYVFPEIDLGVWRPVIPALHEQSEEIPEDDEGKYFWTIGIGVKGYYQNS